MASNQEQHMDDLLKLLIAKLHNDLSEADERILQEWAAASPVNQSLLDELTSDARFAAALRHQRQFDAEKALARLQTRIRTERKTLSSFRRSFFAPIAAAIIVGVLAIGLYFYLPHKQDQPSDAHLSLNSITGGGNRATLTFGNGQTVVLDSSHNGIVVSDETIQYENGTPVADTKPYHTSGPASLTLRTPRGGQYQLTLPDGTKVWLNAASSLTYPPVFSPDERVVEIEGEGYFDIAEKSRQPFRVVSGEQEITVLGTSFNISAYPDENDTKTTLVSGVVRISTPNQSLQLSAGEQSTFSAEGLTKMPVNTEREIAWKNGLFHFTGVPFSQMMRQISRWYDIDIDYNGPIPRTDFRGEMRRGVSLGVLLKFLEESGVTFRLKEGRTLVVTNQ